MVTQADTTRQVLEHHLAAFGAGNVDEILSDYTDDSILIAPEGPLNGRQAIRGFFEAVLASLFKPGSYEFTMDTLHVAEDVAYMVWHSKCASANIVFAADTFLVRNGKIAVQTYAPKIEVKQQEVPSIART